MAPAPSNFHIQALVFDIGGVILHFTPHLAASALARGTSMTPERILAAIEADPQLRDFQEGRVTPEEWHQHLTGQLGLRLDFDQFSDAWNRALGQLILSENLFADLAAQYRLALLSNTDPIHVLHMGTCFNFFRCFPVRVFSCEVGVSKPAPATYKHVARALGAEPQRILYIDDVAEYVEAGRRVGLQAYRFQGASALVGELRRRVVLR